VVTGHRVGVLAARHKIDTRHIAGSADLEVLRTCEQNVRDEKQGLSF
jgi:hypothetical protein